MSIPEDAEVQYNPLIMNAGAEEKGGGTGLLLLPAPSSLSKQLNQHAFRAIIARGEGAQKSRSVEHGDRHTNHGR